jgi:predicted GIY-YIG superfamily endonuclease
MAFIAGRESIITDTDRTLDKLSQIERMKAAVKTQDDARPTTPHHTERPCYVYIMKTHHNSRVKIGISVDPNGRERTLRGDEDLFLWESVKFDKRGDAIDTEYMLHTYFANYRKRGEWFDLPDGYIDMRIDGMIRHIRNQGIGIKSCQKPSPD